MAVFTLERDYLWITHLNVKGGQCSFWMDNPPDYLSFETDFEDE